MKNVSTLNSMFSAQSDYYDHLTNYYFRVAQTKNINQIELLISEVPEVLTYMMSFNDKGYVSFPWALFYNKAYSDSTRPCLELLKKYAFSPDGHFCERIMRNGSAELIFDFIDVFNIDPVARFSDDETWGLIWFVNLEREDGRGLEIFKYLLEKSSDVNAPNGYHNRSILFSLFVGNVHKHEKEVLEAIDLVLKKGADVDVFGYMNGWAHRSKLSEGEVIPLLHAVYWAKYTGRSIPSIVGLAESICDPSILDANGRTAQEYLQFLIDTQATK